MRNEFLCFVVGVLALSSVGFSQNLVQDGGFETPTVVNIPPGYDRYFSGDVFGSWTVDSHNVDLVGPRWTAFSGAQSLDLDGAVPGAVSQVLPTVAGQDYDLSFELAGSPGGGSAIKTVEILWGGNDVGILTFDTTGHTFSDMGWTLQQLNSLPATGTSTTLEFESLDASDSGFGPALDDVVVTAVPEPAAPVVLLLVCAASLLRRRMRSDTTFGD